MKDVCGGDFNEKLEPNDIAVLILSTQAHQYKQFQQAIRNTWMRRLKAAGVHVYFYAGEHKQNGVVADEIQLITSDKLVSTAEKLKAAIKILFAAHPNLKLIYRTNLSSYIEIGNFFRFIEKNRLSSRSYAGVKGKTTYLREYFYGNRWLHILFGVFPVGPAISFASGSGFFIGIEHARKLIDLERGNELIDDVMVASALDIAPDPVIAPVRFDIMENEAHRISSAAYCALVENKLLFHYRFKTMNRERDAVMLEMFDDPAVRYYECTILK